MDIGDVTDPNLDGDFQTLLEARQVRVSPRLCCRYADKTNKKQQQSI